MEFGFSEAQRDVQELARRILGDHVGPETLAAYDEYRAERHVVNVFSLHSHELVQ